MSRVITLQRLEHSRVSTIGDLWVFGTHVFTLEDGKRLHKVWGETRIPAGRYRLELRKEGGMHGRYVRRFGAWHRGMIWILDVPNWEWVYIHPGNTPADTLGCPLTGLIRGVDRVDQSLAAYRLIYPPIADAIESEGCFIDIFDEPDERVALAA